MHREDPAPGQPGPTDVERALRESEARYHTLFRTMGQGYALVELIRDANGKAVDQLYLEFNPAIGRLLGISAEEATGKRASEVFPTLEPWWTETFERVVREGSEERLEHHVAAVGRWFQVFAYPAGGDRFVTLVEDITERKEAEARLRESEDRLQQFGEASQDILWMRDAQTLQWTYLTPAFEQIYGLPREEALAGDNFHTWLEMIVPEDRERARDSIARVRLGEHVEFEYRVQRPDGSIRWLRDTDFPIRNEAGEVAVIGGVGEDFTERKRNEERMRTLVAELQHRVRNILGVMRSVFMRSATTAETSESLRDHFVGRLDSMARTQVVVTQTRHGTINLEDLIRDELFSVGVSDGPQLSLGGPEVDIPTGAAESIGLAIHELTTNAVKYGAVSCPTGKITIRWSVNLDYGEGPRLLITWAESGVPNASPKPSRNGFGTELITQALPYRLGAETSLEFLPGGLRCIIDMPLPEPAASKLNRGGHLF